MFSAKKKTPKVQKKKRFSYHSVEREWKHMLMVALVLFLIVVIYSALDFFERVEERSSFEESATHATLDETDLENAFEKYNEENFRFNVLLEELEFVPPEHDVGTSIQEE